MNKITIRLIAILLFTLTALIFTSCGNIATVPGAQPGIVYIYDREGFLIALPAQRDSIISIGPANTEILVALGFGDSIIQTDIHSADIDGIRPGISELEFFDLDLEYIISLNPDVIFITGMTRVPGNADPLGAVSAAGISVVYMPSSTSIADIKEDIRFMAYVLGADSVGEGIIADMNAEIEHIRAISETITERRSVYFEVGAAPTMVSFGTGTFLNEMIELAGAVNIFAGQEGWMVVADEVLIEMNPDVILTSVFYIADPVSEIMNRPGWHAITAVQNNDVFVIDTNSSSRANHNIVYALWEIARAVYPELFL